MTNRTPLEVVTVYLDELYNKGRTEMAGELIADPTWRHEDAELKALSRVDTVQRLKDNFTRWPTMRFDSMETLVDGDRVAVAWNGTLTSAAGETEHLYGIEIFRVREGLIVEIWNSKFGAGLWQTSPLG